MPYVSDHGNPVQVTGVPFTVLPVRSPPGGRPDGPRAPPPLFIVYRATVHGVSPSFDVYVLPVLQLGNHLGFQVAEDLGMLFRPG